MIIVFIMIIVIIIPHNDNDNSDYNSSKNSSMYSKQLTLTPSTTQCSVRQILKSIKKDDPDAMPIWLVRSYDALEYLNTWRRHRKGSCGRKAKVTGRVGFGAISSLLCAHSAIRL